MWRSIMWAKSSSRTRSRVGREEETGWEGEMERGEMGQEGETRRGGETGQGGGGGQGDWKEEGKF